jgi:hypothetical protein
MIALWSDCLLFQLSTGECIPSSAELISVEVMGDAAGKFDPEVVRHASASVFHYFKHDLGRKTVSVAEFAEALEKVLRELGLWVRSAESAPPSAEDAHRATADLRLLARELGESLELFFFPRLRDELRIQLRQSPRIVRFRGLRGCVKQLAGARRWSLRCENLQDQIVEYLRQCLSAEPCEAECALVVE